MKKLQLLFIGFLAAFYFMSCSEETDPLGTTVEPIPTVTIPNTAPTTAKPGDLIDFTVAIVAEARIDNIKLIRTDGPSPLTIDNKTNGFTNNTSDNYRVSFTVTAQDAGKTITLEFVVTDKKERTNSPAIYSLTVETATEELSEVTLGSYNNSSSGSFFDLSAKEVRNISFANSNSSQIDFAYSWGTGSDANIFALSDPIADNFFGTNTNNWSNLKNTQFKKLSATEGVSLYNSAATETEIKGYYDNATGDAASRLTQLVANDVFVIKIDNGSVTEGFFIAKVNSVNTGNAGSISLAIKGIF